MERLVGGRPPCRDLLEQRDALGPVSLDHRLEAGKRVDQEPGDLVVGRRDDRRRKSRDREVLVAVASLPGRDAGIREQRDRSGRLERRDLARGVHEHRNDIGRSAAADRGEPVHSCKFGPQNRVADERRRLVRAYDGLLVSAREAQVARRADEPPASTGDVGRELGGPLQGSRSGNVRRSFLRARGRIIEGADDIDVVLDGGRRQMPGAAIVVFVVAGKRGGEGAVRVAALARRRGTVDGRADQRMPELQPRCR